MPGYFCFFFAYEFSREVLRPEGKTKDEIGLWRTMISGGMAGIALWTVIFPADVIKSRQQVSIKIEIFVKSALRQLRSDQLRWTTQIHQLRVSLLQQLSMWCMHFLVAKIKLKH